MTTLVTLEPFINDCTNILKTRFDEFAKAAETIDLPHWLQCYAFDVIGNITVSERQAFFLEVTNVQTSLANASVSSTKEKTSTVSWPR